VTKVLVIDDDAAIVDILRTVLEEAGFTVMSAASIDKVPLGTKTDCIIVDLVGMGGYSLDAAKASLRPVRARFAEVPLILATAHRISSVDREAFGVMGVLNKPFELDEIVRVTTAAISR
jgi:DNA-binding response OmpR family regulator